jgi:hypothetical protein
MIKETCEVCMQPITNPICVGCYIKQIEAWLKDIHMTAIPRSVIISQIKKNMVFDSLNEEECVICRKDSVSICSYCFFKQVSIILHKMEVRAEFVDVFLASFNYVQQYDNCEAI